MKIAYLSNYKEISGYSYAARGYIDALESTNEEIAAKNISLIGGITDKDSSNLNDVDVTILHTLPDFYQKTKSKTIGLFAWETTKLPDEWIEKINFYTDAIIVPNEDEKECFKSQVDVPVYCVPHCVEIDFDKNKKVNIGGNLINQDTHIFYTISSDSNRKNINAIIASYLTEFRSYDNCILFLQINGDKQKIIEKIENIKAGYKLNDYPKILVNTTILEDQDLIAIHNTCDTYVSLSHGESFNIPACKAAMLNKNMVLTPCGGHKMYHADFVKADLSPCYGSLEQPQHLYKGDGMWYNCGLMDSRQKMRECFDNGKSITHPVKNLVEKFSKNTIGEQLVNICREVIN